MASEPSHRTDGSSDWARKEHWDSAAALYDDAVGRYSQSAAARLVTLADAALPFSSPSAAAIDLGAGTGSITHTLAARFPELSVVATDVSESMLTQLRAKAAPGAHITTRIVNMAAPVDGDGAEERRRAYSHALCSFALQVLQSPQAGVDGMHALLRPGGVVALATWAFDEWCGPNEVWRAAATAVDPGWQDPLLARELRTSLPELTRYLANAGFRDIRPEIWRGEFGVGPQGLMEFFGRETIHGPRRVGQASKATWTK